MQLITVCLVFLDSCGCDPTPRIHLRVERPGWRSMAPTPPEVKRETIARKGEKGKSNVNRRITRPITLSPHPQLNHWANGFVRPGQLPAVSPQDSSWQQVRASKAGFDRAIFSIVSLEQFPVSPSYWRDPSCLHGPCHPCRAMLQQRKKDSTTELTTSRRGPISSNLHCATQWPTATLNLAKISCQSHYNRTWSRDQSGR